MKTIFQLSKRSADQVAVVAEVDEPLARALVDLARQVRQQVVAVDVHLEGLAGGLVALLQLVDRRRARRPRRGTSAASRGAARSRWTPRRPGSCPASAPSAARGRRLPSWCPSRCGTASSPRPARCSCAARCRCCTSRSCPRRCPSSSSSVEQLADVAGRGRSSCRGRATATGRPGRCSRAWCACAGACGWCSPSRRTALPAPCWRLMKSDGGARRTRRRSVSMRFRVSGPVSSIFCLPTRPQRGCSVGSSSSVAKQRSTPRGPKRSLELAGSRWRSGSPGPRDPPRR